MAGGSTDQTTKYAGVYNPATNKFCNLPTLTVDDVHKASHTVSIIGNNRIISCGGQVHPKSCYEFNPDTGKGIWEESYKFDVHHSGHVAWRNNKGVLLMGGQGYGSQNIQTTQLLASGTGSTPGFNLTKPCLFCCAVEDPNTKSVILIGGSDETRTVIRYYEDGTSETLPALSDDYPGAHSCAGYYNDDEKLEILVFGDGYSSGATQRPTLALTVGDSSWEDLGDITPERYYHSSATVDNEVFMQGIVTSLQH